MSDIEESTTFTMSDAQLRAAIHDKVKKMGIELPIMDIRIISKRKSKFKELGAEITIGTLPEVPVAATIKVEPQNTVPRISAVRQSSTKPTSDNNEEEKATDSNSELSSTGSTTSPTDVVGNLFSRD